MGLPANNVVTWPRNGIAFRCARFGARTPSLPRIEVACWPKARPDAQRTALHPKRSARHPSGPGCLPCRAAPCVSLSPRLMGGLPTRCGVLLTEVSRGARSNPTVPARKVGNRRVRTVMLLAERAQRQNPCHIVALDGWPIDGHVARARSSVASDVDRYIRAKHDGLRLQFADHLESGTSLMAHPREPVARQPRART